MVERFLRDITTERLRRGVFTSVPDLVAAIHEYVAHHNTKPKPFIWTKSVSESKCVMPLTYVGHVEDVMVDPIFGYVA